MLRDSVAEPISTESTFPVVFAPRNDGGLQFCVNYPKLNAVTVRNSHPLPQMNKRVVSLGIANVFLTLDANNGSLQRECDDRDMDETAFVKHNHLYRYTRVPFGLRTALLLYRGRWTLFWRR